MMIDSDIGEMYDRVLNYLGTKQGYYADASMPDKEFNDYIDFDLTLAIDIIQRQIRGRPNIGESATIKGYRDMRASAAEYDIRKMSRSDYWQDAIDEEEDNINKWAFNKKVVYLNMNGKDTGY